MSSPDGSNGGLTRASRRQLVASEPERGPEKAGQLTRDRHGDLGRGLVVFHQASEAATQSLLRLVRHCDDPSRLPLASPPLRDADARPMLMPNEPNAVKRLVRMLERDAPGPVRMCYDAGPCGYALQRQVATARVSCQVIAPGLIPRKPGDRIKTNRRDARKLAELFRAGLLTEVRPPTST